MKQERVILVDEHDRVIGSKPRNEVDFSRDIFRASGIWITDSAGRILLAKRSMAKAKDPGRWGPAVAGTLEEGETYLENAIKEFREELGIAHAVLLPGPKQYVDTPRKIFYQWFLYVLDRDISGVSRNPDEVDQLAWVESGNLVQDVQGHPESYVPFMGDAIRMLIP